MRIFIGRNRVLKYSIFKNCIAWAAALLTMLVVWVILHAAVGNELVFPAFFDCVKQAVALLQTGGFWKSLLHTFLRTLGAFGISFILAAILAVLSYMLPTFGRFFAPFAAAMRAIPTLAVLLLILLWAKAAIAPVVVATLTLLPMLYAGFLAAIARTDKNLLEMSRVYQVPWKKRLMKLYLPTVAPYAVKEGTAALSLGLKLVASAEVLAATAVGLGGMMQESKIYLDVPRLFALVIVTVCIGLIVELIGGAIARAAERRWA